MQGTIASAYTHIDTCLTAGFSGESNVSLTRYFGFLRIKGNHHNAKRMSAITPPWIANPPIQNKKNIFQ
jgi:hypothetical protein